MISILKHIPNYSKGIASYYLSERLKIKHLFVNKLSFISALFTFLFALLLGETADSSCVFLLNWSYSLIIPVVISFSCALLSHVDGQMNNRAIKVFPLNYQKVWGAKVWVGLIHLFQYCVCLLLAYGLLRLLYHSSEAVIRFPNAILGIILIFILFAWQVPLYLFAGYKVGRWLTLVIGIVMNMAGVIVFAMKEYWYLFPFAYPGRLLCPVLGIMPNGFLLQPDYAGYDPALASCNVLPTGIVVSVVLLILMVHITSVWFWSKEVIG
jgi:ABC-2 type transport system permease protein